MEYHFAHNLNDALKHPDVQYLHDRLVTNGTHKDLVRQLLELGLDSERKVSLVGMDHWFGKQEKTQFFDEARYERLMDYADSKGLMKAAMFHQLVLTGLNEVGHLDRDVVQYAPETLDIGLTPEQVDSLSLKGSEGNEPRSVGRPKGAGERMCFKLPQSVYNRVIRYGPRPSTLIRQWMHRYLLEQPKFKDMSDYYSLERVKSRKTVNWIPIQISMLPWQVELVKSYRAHYGSGYHLGLTQVILAIADL